MKKLILLLTTMPLLFVSCNSRFSSEPQEENSTVSEMVSLDFEDVSPEIERGWELIKNKYSSVEQCSAYYIGNIEENNQYGELYYVIYEVNDGLNTFLVHIGYFPHQWESTGSIGVYSRGSFEEFNELFGDELSPIHYVNLH